MEIEYLNEFAEVARLESFSRAAEELCISQSSLSKHILALERELGGPLLQRNSRNVTMTPLGATILPMAEEIVRIKNQIHTMADAREEREKRTLSVASLPVMAQYGITELLARFRRDNQWVNLEVTECERQELHDLLDSGKCSLAFVRRGMEDGEDSELEYLELYPDRLVAVVSRKNPLAEKDHITMDDLREEPLLFLDQQTGFHHLYISLCRAAGFIPQIAYTGLRPENILSMAAQNMGVALVMAGHAAYVPRPEVRILELLPTVERPVCLARWRNRRLPALADRFWEYVKNDSGTESANA